MPFYTLEISSCNRVIIKRTAINMKDKARIVINSRSKLFTVNLFIKGPQVVKH